VPDTTLELCSFCSKHKDAVQKLIVSDSVAICNECVDLCQELLSDRPHDQKPSFNTLDPRSIKSYTDQWVVGQDHAKMVLAVAVVNHYKRLSRTPADPEIAKANVLMLGPTGSGKTLLARSIARYLDVPFVVADATSLTEAGYVGDDVESLISRLHANSGYDISRTQRGIVFVDEIDKISRRSESASITRDVSGEGVQQALLKLVEGTVCRIPQQGNRKHPASDMLEIDTTNILFIAGGAFVGIDGIIGRRLRGTSIGFSTPLAQDHSADLSAVTPDDLVKFGMIPEFVGRFPVSVALAALTRQDLLNILITVKDNLQQQYQWLFAQDDIELYFDPKALEAIVDRAQASGTGARALHGEMERVLLPHMFSANQYREAGIKRIDIMIEDINNPEPRQG
jgi:ATP-dependent Clp protease ATP-binding subunit ClpX